MRFFANAQNDFEFSWFLREGPLRNKRMYCHSERNVVK